jgi:hypothetical protein
MLLPEHGDEKTALDSVHSLFGTTREILRRKGRDCVQFTKIAVVVLNQVVRPFTAKWHKPAMNKAFKDPKVRAQFHSDLADLQVVLRKYTKALADIAGVDGPFFTGDGPTPYLLEAGNIDGAAIGLDSGSDENAFAQAALRNPRVPAFSSETYPGWLTHWGDRRQNTTP